MHMTNRAVTLFPRHGHYAAATAHHILGVESACGAPSRKITEKCKEFFESIFKKNEINNSQNFFCP